MTTFFDPTSTADLALVVKTFRDHPDMPVIALDAETDVVGYYTRRFPGAQDFNNNYYSNGGYSLGNGVWVSLLGFNPDASQVTDAGLVYALKVTIAKVIQWRLSKVGENEALQHVTTALGVGKDRVAEWNHQFPPGDWDYRLLRWDLRLPVYSI